MHAWRLWRNVPDEDVLMDFAKTLIGIALLGGVGYVAYKILAGPKQTCSDGQHSLHNDVCYTCVKGKWVTDAPQICNPAIGCDTEGEENCGTDHFVWVCQNGKWVKTTETCINPCELVGPCVPDIYCDENNNLYNVSCNPANGQCDLHTLIAENSATCISREPYIINVYWQGNNIIGGNVWATNTPQNVVPFFSGVKSADVNLRIEILDRAHRPCPNTYFEIEQTPNDIGGFQLPGSPADTVNCSRYSGTTNYDGTFWVRWICMVDQGAGVISHLSWTFEAGTRVAKSGITHVSIGASDPLGLLSGQACWTAEANCMPFVGMCYKSASCNYIRRPAI